MTRPFELIITLLNGCGAMALVAVTFGQLERMDISRRVRPLLQGCLFGMGAVLAMHSAVQILPGYYVDSRSIFIGFAAAFAGWPAAIIAMCITAIARVTRGGAGTAAAMFALPIAAMAGVTWRHFLGKRPARLACLAALGAAISCTMLVSLFVLPLEDVRTQLGNMGLLFAANVGATVALGSLIERETRLIEKERLLVEEARYDGLTGLLNRRSFETRANALLGAASEEIGVGLLILDLDHFKNLNDSFGHAFGDEVLRATSDLIGRHLPAGGAAGRLGGEEFGIVVVGAPPQDIAARIRTELEESLIRFGRVPVKVTASIGVSVARQSSTFADAFLASDAALYAAKRLGRNRVEVDVLPKAA